MYIRMYVCMYDTTGGRGLRFATCGGYPALFYEMVRFSYRVLDSAKYTIVTTNETITLDLTVGRRGRGTDGQTKQNKEMQEQI